MILQGISQYQHDTRQTFSRPYEWSRLCYSVASVVVCRRRLSVTVAKLCVRPRAKVTIDIL